MLICRPWMRENIPTPPDPKQHPMFSAMQYWLNAVMVLIFLIMFACSLAVSITDMEGIGFILLGYVVPYGVLVVGIACLKPLGKWIYIRTAEKEYGENWPSVVDVPGDSGV